MEKIKLSIKNNAKENINKEEINELKQTINEKYNVILPSDYCEFLELSNGYNFNNYKICSNKNITKYTDELKELIDDWDPNLTENFENYIVVGNIYEHGYVVYLNESKKYFLIEDLFDDFTLDGKDEGLYEFSSIWDIFIYYDYNCGDKTFEKEYNKIFKIKIQKEEESQNEFLEKNKEAIKKLKEEIKNGEAIELKINVNDEYIKVLSAEYERDINILKMGSYSTIKYSCENSFLLNINFLKNKIDILSEEKLASKSFPSLDFTIASIIDKKKYYVLKVKSSAVEPIIIFKSILNKEEIHKIENKYINKKSLLKRILNIG